MGFNRYVVSNVSTPTDVVTCPADTVITVIGITVANVTGVITEVNIQAAGVSLLKGVEIMEGSAIVPVGGEQKIVLIAGDSIKVEADNAVDVYVSVLEQTI